MGLTQQEEAEGLVTRDVVADEHIATDDGLDTRSTRCFVELHQPEHIGKVSERQRRHRIRLRRNDRFVYAYDAIGDGIFAVKPKVDEGGLHDAREENLARILPLGGHRFRGNYFLGRYLLPQAESLYLLASSPISLMEHTFHGNRQDSDVL